MPKCQGEVQSRVSLRYRTGPRALAIVRLVVSKMTIFNVAGTLVVPIASWKSKSDPVLMTASGQNRKQPVSIMGFRSAPKAAVRLAALMSAIAVRLIGRTW